MFLGRPSVPLRLVFIYNSQLHSSQTSARQPEFGWGHGLAWVTLKSILDISMIHFRATGMGGFSAEPSNFWVAVSSCVSRGAATPVTWDMGTKN